MRVCIRVALACCLIGCGPGSVAGNTEAVGDTDSTDTAINDESGGETGTGETGETGDFVDTGCADGCLPDECDPFGPDCPTGEKCVPWVGQPGSTYNGYKCVLIEGEGQPGEACHSLGAGEAADDCGADSFCWDPETPLGEFEGVCIEICGGEENAPTCSGDRVCVDTFGVSHICLDLCDPLAQQCPNPGDACYWNLGSFNCLPTSENLPAGAACEFLNDCAPGNFCVDAEYLASCEGTSCCTAFCQLELGDEPCQAIDPAHVCVPFYEEGQAPGDLEGLGVCVLPQ